MGETAEVGEPPEDDGEWLLSVVTTLPVLRASCVTVAREKTKGGALGPGDKVAGNRLAQKWLTCDLITWSVVSLLRWRRSSDEIKIVRYCKRTRSSRCKPGGAGPKGLLPTQTLSKHKTIHGTALLTHVVAIQSIVGSQCAPSPAPVAGAAFETYKLYRRCLASHALRIASSNTSPRVHSSCSFSPLMDPTALSSSAAAMNASWSNFLPPAFSPYLRAQL